jgi:hypothetical protein
MNWLPDEHRDELDHSPFIHCTRLENLGLNGCIKRKDIKAIGQLGRLKKLTMMTNCDELETTDEDFEVAFEQRQLITLQQFELRGYHKFGRKAVMALLKRCPNLIYLSCCNHSLRRDPCQIVGIAASVLDCDPKAIKLQKLELSSCTLNINEISAVASLCNLRELHILGSSSSQQDYRDAFQQGKLVNLKVLTLKYCWNLDSEGFKALMKNSSKLQDIKIHLLRSVTGYTEIFKECNLEHLETFLAIECRHFGKGDADFLRLSCPRIRVVYHRICWDFV